MSGSPGPASGPRFTVVVPAFNAKDTIRRCLNSVQAAIEAWGEAQLIIVDNGSTDGTYDLLLEQYASRAQILRDPTATVGALRNLGARSGAGNLLSFVDADCLVPRDYYYRAWEALQRSGAAATGSGYALPEAPHWIELVWYGLHRRRTDGDVHYLNAGNLVVTREAFEVAGGFNESLITGEDAEFGQRFVHKGYRIYEDRNVVAVHLGNPQSLRAFCRQQWWHGLGMFGTAGGPKLDKPLAMTLLHLLLSVGAVGWAAFREPPLPAAGWSIAAQAVTPAFTVLYRCQQTGRFSRPFQSLVLYYLYYWSRVVALSTLILGAPRADRGRR